MMPRQWLATVLAATISLSLIGCGLCGNDVLSEVRSPDGAKRAVVFRRDCGATTDYTLHVSILGAASRLSNDQGNVFRALNDGKAPPIAAQVVWEDSRHLLVRFPARARVYRQSANVGLIRIAYETLR